MSVYFAQREHAIVASSPLVPANDPTLLFTNSGMVQFKDVFLGREQRPYKRATTSQRSLRAGGKHNDLENVGYTARHHTFFEMLGNFSFGDYFKEKAIPYAWELLTADPAKGGYGLPADKLWVTVYETDDQAYDIWAKEVGVPVNRIVRIGDQPGGKKYESDNFWQMADTGPCGPCSEIFYDHGPSVTGGPPGSADAHGDRYIEIWNLVFMQFDRQKNGDEFVMNPLPRPSVDTGMGLERLAAVLQHVHSNYEIDLFQTLIKAAAEATGTKDLRNKSLNVIADHIRAVSFLIVDGNEGRGYVLRRIARRAIRHGYMLGQKQPFFYRLARALTQAMGEAYPELTKDEARVAQIVKTEEERFAETLENGMGVLDRALAEILTKHNHQTGAQARAGSWMLPGEVAFTLYDTYGFPLDLTADVCRERGYTVDQAGFDAAMDKQREQARAAGKFKMAAGLEYDGAQTMFVGYDKLVEPARVLAIYRDGTSVNELKIEEEAVVVLDKTPFYAESGGQAGDTGELRNNDYCFAVRDTQKIQANVFGHQGVLLTGTKAMRAGDALHAQVNEAMRARTMRNHSATHIMHKALRQVLGAHVQQKGSLVDAEKTRFDFSHNAAMTAQEIATVEQLVNNEILQNAATQARVMPIDDAQKLGAMMLFGEKYGDEVRVLDIGSSRELCGGTHVQRTGDIGLFKIVGQSAVAAGVRRVEAITGDNTLAYLRAQETQLAEIAEALKVAPPDALARVKQTLEGVKALEKELAQVKSKMASSQGDDLADQAQDVKGIKVLAARMDGADAKALRETMDKLKDKLKSAAIVLGAVADGKVSLIAGVTADLTNKVKAGELVNHVAMQVGGKGGGRPDMAQAGGTEPQKLPGALASVSDWVAARM
jgi:alanyl-tRNA synthetase